MKWIGQHVYDYIANFRNTVIIDGVSISAVQTSAESFADNDTSLMTSAAIDDRINTAVTAEDLDLTTDSGTIAIDLDSETLTIAGGTGIDTSATSNTVTVGLSSTITTDALTFTSANADDPLITIQNTTDNNQGARLKFNKNRGGDASDNDVVGEIEFHSYDDGTPSTQQYAKILAQVHDATSGEESGRLKFGVASHDGSNDFGLILTGGSASNEVDVTVGLGTDSLTTIAGDLSITTGLLIDSVDITAVQTGSEEFIDNDTSLMTSAAIENKIHTRAKTSSTDGDYDGDVVYLGGTTSMTTGAIYHYKSDGTWELADADSEDTCDGLLAVALGAASDTNGMLLRGMVTLDHDPGAVGDVLFLSTTGGDCSATAPSGTGDIIRVVGYCLDASNGQIWFNPDGTYVEVA